MDETLSDLSKILFKHGNKEQAEVVCRLLKLRHDRDQAEFVALIQGGDMWGGSGAVWEVGDLAEDTLAFRNKIIQLAVQMDDAGIWSDGSRFAASTFRKWNKQGV